MILVNRNDLQGAGVVSTILFSVKNVCKSIVEFVSKTAGLSTSYVIVVQKKVIVETECSHNSKKLIVVYIFTSFIFSIKRQAYISIVVFDSRREVLITCLL